MKIVTYFLICFLYFFPGIFVPFSAFSAFSAFSVWEIFS